jgi:transketolase
MRDAFISSLIAAAEEDPDIVLLTGDLGFGVFENFATKFPKQFFNAGVAEQSMISMASGMASTGKKVFAYSIGNFSTMRCLEQIRNDICYQKNPVTVVSVGGGYAYGNLGYSHHAIEDFSIMRTLPGLEIISPADKFEVSKAISAIIANPKPYYLRLGRNGEHPIHRELSKFEPGKFIEINNGTDGAILFTGSIGLLAVAAREELLKLSTAIALYSVPYVNRIDTDKLIDIARYKKILVLEEHFQKGGLGSEILETLNDFKLQIQVKVLGSNRNNISLIGGRDYLLKNNGLTLDAIISYFQEDFDRSIN